MHVGSVCTDALPEHKRFCLTYTATRSFRAYVPDKIECLYMCNVMLSFRSKLHKADTQAAHGQGAASRAVKFCHKHTSKVSEQGQCAQCYAQLTCKAVSATVTKCLAWADLLEPASGPCAACRHWSSPQAQAAGCDTEQPRSGTELCRQPSPAEQALQ